jgi:hypothetical protein
LIETDISVILLPPPLKRLSVPMSVSRIGSCSQHRALVSELATRRIVSVTFSAATLTVATTVQSAPATAAIERCPSRRNRMISLLRVWRHYRKQMGVKRLVKPQVISALRF